MNLFAPLVFSSVIAGDGVAKTFFGIAPWYQIPPFPAATLPQLPWFVLLGVPFAAPGGRRVPETAAFGEEQFRKLHCRLYLRLTLAGFDRGHHRRRISGRMRQRLFRDQ